MKTRHLVFFATLLLTVWNAALIWMTQVMCYPLWPLVGSGSFHDYHIAWWHSVWWTFIPAGLALIGSISLLFARPLYFPRWAAIGAVAAQLVALFVTLIFWAPLQASLSTSHGLDLSGFHTLLWTHWFRVALLWVPAAFMSGALAKRMAHIPE